MQHRELLSGLVPPHFLHCAVEGEVCGQRMADELAWHVSRLGSRALYPMLRAPKRESRLVAREGRLGHFARELYRATPTSREAVDEARLKVEEAIQGDARAIAISEKVRR
jgi:hypothetical protein